MNWMASPVNLKNALLERPALIIQFSRHLNLLIQVVEFDRFRVDLKVDA